ncbi:MAG: serine/threonine protein kinase [Planctomycetota bacterium]
MYLATILGALAHETGVATPRQVAECLAEWQRHADEVLLQDYISGAQCGLAEGAGAALLTAFRDATCHCVSCGRFHRGDRLKLDGPVLRCPDCDSQHVRRDPPVREAVRQSSGQLFESCAPDTPDTVQLAGCWRVSEQVGVGAVGRVYKAWQDHLDRHAAVMTMEVSAQLEFVERFQRAAGVWSRLHHPQVAQVIATARYNGRPAILVEWMDGGSLHDVLVEHGPLAPTMVADAGAAVARALASAHETGLIHGDVNARNILWSRDGGVKLSGFSLDAVRDAALRSADDAQPFAEPPFRAPEQLARSTIGPQTDTWLLGATMFHLLTGTCPLAGEPLPDVGELQPRVPPAFASMLMTMTDARPAARRPESMDQIATQLERLASVEPQTAGHHVSRPTRRIGAGLLGSVEVIELPPHPVLRDWIELQLLINVLHGDGAVRFVIDLSRCDSLSGSGASALAHLQQSTGGAVRVVLAGVPARVKIVIDMLGVAGYLRIAPDVAAAITLLGGGEPRHHRLRDPIVPEQK